MAFICIGEVTEPVKVESLKMGFWTDAGKRDYPKVQILTIAGLPSGAVKAKLPSQLDRSMLGFKSNAQEKTGLQNKLF